MCVVNAVYHSRKREGEKTAKPVPCWGWGGGIHIVRILNSKIPCSFFKK